MVKMVTFMFCVFCHNLEKCPDVGSSYLQTHRLPGFIVWGSSSACSLHMQRGCPGLPRSHLCAACSPARVLVRAASAQKGDAFPGVYKGAIGPPALCLWAVSAQRGAFPKAPVPLWGQGSPARPCPSQLGWELPRASSPYFQVVRQHRAHS